MFIQYCVNLDDLYKKKNMAVGGNIGALHLIVMMTSYSMEVTEEWKMTWCPIVSMWHCTCM